MRRKRRSVSRCVSDVVGSSKMMMRGIELDGLGDLDELALAGRQALERRLGREVETDLLEQFARACARRLARSISATGPIRRRGKFAEEDVLGDGEIGEEVEFLVDEGDAAGRPHRPGRRGA